MPEKVSPLPVRFNALFLGGLKMVVTWAEETEFSPEVRRMCRESQAWKLGERTTQEIVVEETSTGLDS